MGGGGGGGCGMKRGREGMSVHKSHDQAHLLLRMGSLDTTGFPHKRTGVRAITMPIVVSDAWHTADSCVVQNYCSKQYTVTLCYLCRLSCPMFGIPRIIVLCGTTAYQAMWPWAMLTGFFISEHRKITNCLSLLEGG